MVLMDVARAAGLMDGEKVEIETQDSDIVMRRRSAHAQARQDAAEAAEEIVAESHAQSLRGISISELRDEGRRG